MGIVGFDISPFVVVPLEPVGTIRDRLDSQLDRLKARGKTYLLPALVEAKRQLEEKKASWKHVIILSDGETGGSGSDYIDLVTEMKEGKRITISTIAIGNQANIPLLKRISQYGGGLFHHTYDPKTLPQILLRDLSSQPKEEKPKKKDWVPLIAEGSRLLARFSGQLLPPVQGFVDNEMKPEASLDLLIRRDALTLPLMASWKYGNGRVVAFATDLHGQWAREWIRWEGLEKLWGEVWDWLVPLRDPLPPHEVRINPVGDHAILDFYIYQETEADSAFRYSLKGPGEKQDGDVIRVAPGHYQATLPATKTETIGSS